ncbi:MAG: phage tail protein [Thermodesulfobacteriota bacterium]|nr:phage tail protein [Thermodesulfobacteriota bacterium]
MSTKPTTYLGDQLYRLLPEVYRTRDNGDMAGVLDSCGELLDRMYFTLQQRLADCFPDIGRKQLKNDEIIESRCQDWILPYFADLLDVQLVSPESDGRRQEVANAVSWRQRKGTLACIEELAQAVAQTEVEIQEGWKRVATTARIDMPLLPASTYGTDEEPDMETPGQAARHPGLPAVTVDFRFPSRSAQTDVNNPAAHRSSFSGQTVSWRQSNLHGAPCFPASYNDVSKRTVDLRTPDEKRGHFHPKRILLFAPLPDEFFGEDVQSIVWSERDDKKNIDLFDIEDTETNLTFRALTDKALRIEGLTELTEDKIFRFERVRIDNTLVVQNGRLELFECAVQEVDVQRADTESAVFTADNVLLHSLKAESGLVRLEYCTVLGGTAAAHLQASDCIFMGSIHKDLVSSLPPPTGCIRFSRIPESLVGFVGDKLYLAEKTLTTDEPIFFSETFAKVGCGVLHSASSDAIRFGAENGGEMGAYHSHHHVLRVQSALEKLKGFLPFGMEAVWVYDSLLHVLPPEEQ